MSKDKDKKDGNNAEQTRSTGQGRAVMIAHPKTGATVRRVDFIREEFKVRGSTSRGDIARDLGVVYQIVFAATKGMTFDDKGKYIEPPPAPPAAPPAKDADAGFGSA